MSIVMLFKVIFGTAICYAIDLIVIYSIISFFHNFMLFFLFV